MKVITSHHNADFDSLSSMVAAKKLYPDAVLVFPGSQEKTLRDFLIHSTFYMFDFEKVKNLDYDAVDTLVLVDTRQRDRIGELARLVDKPGMKIHIFDHHPDGPGDIKGAVEIIRSTGATVSILVDMLKEAGVSITPEEATIMMLGIYEETGSFLYPSTTVEDFEAASYLLSRGANVNVVSDMLIKEFTPEQISLLNELIRNSVTVNANGVDVVITEESTETYVGDIAVIVQKLRDIENINVIFALFRMEDRVYIIARSRIAEVDVGFILSLFGGGGHKEAASATVRDMTLPEVKDKLLEYLQTNVKPLYRARDIMFFPVKSVDAQDTIQEAKSIMVKYNINALPVLSNEKVVGVISRQIAEKAAFHKLESMPVKEYMSTDAMTVKEDDSIEKAKDMIIGGHQRFLPVTRDGRLVGAITRTDLLRVLEDEIGKALRGKVDVPEPYHKRKNVKKLMQERLEDETYEKLVRIGDLADEMGYHAFLVGGIVRDLLLRIDNYDVDIVIEGEGIRFAEEMADRWNAKVRPHKEFGTAKVVFPDGFKLDIATARLEYYRSPASLPVVEHSSLKLDLQRRDFTMNTLAIALNRNTFGQLIDFFGGQRDIKENTIRVLHSLSFVEDPTRVFRAIRFEHRFGFQIGRHTMSLIKNAVKMNFLSRLRGKRIWAELSLMVLEEEPEKILKRLQGLDLLRFVHPALVFDREKEKLFARINVVSKWYELLYKNGPCERGPLYLIGLLDRMKEPEMEEFLERLEVPERLKVRTRANMAQARETLNRLSTGFYLMRKSEIFRLIDPLSPEVKLFVMAKTRSEEIKKAISNVITYSDSFKPIVTGADLKVMGVREGPLYKEILERLLDAKIDRGLKTKEMEMEFVKAYLSERMTIQ